MGSVTAFCEDWALYVERLGLGAGFHQDLFSNFGRLVFEMSRRRRLVVDTGIHCLGWTCQQAIEFSSKNAALTMLHIRSEVD